MTKHSQTWIRAAAFGVVLAAAGGAHAETYGKLEVGAGFNGKLESSGPDADLEKQWHIGGAVGGNVTPNVRLEGELSHGRADIKNGFGGTQTTLAMANAYYDFAPDARFTPFVGGGIGAASVNPTGTGRDTGFAYKLTGGVATKLSDRMTGELAYRHTAAKNLNFGGPDVDYQDNAVTAGVRIKLGQ